MWTNGRTGVTELIVFFCNCAKKRDVRNGSTRRGRIERYFYFSPLLGRVEKEQNFFRIFSAFARSPF